MRRLRTGLLCFIGTVVVALTCMYANSAKSDAPANQAPDLLERFATLESRVAELEERLLDQTLFLYQRPVTSTAGPIVDLVPAPMSPRAPSAVAPSPQTPSGIPPGLTPHYFNGGAYYIVPLTKEASE
ncbi:MAG TPA: hypothetical protein VJ828_15640 [Lacipirellulaceae bacterium]|nr:hypothetical protein [Lacipirellulaceae bacterium]